MDVTFNNDGTKMFVLGDHGNDINEYMIGNVKYLMFGEACSNVPIFKS